MILSCAKFVAGALFLGMVALDLKANAETRLQTDATKKKSAITAKKQVPVLNEWFALGSGCRARFDFPGDVTVEPLTTTKAQAHAVRFHLSHYELTEQAATKPKGQFARECAIRIKINPPDNKRIRHVSAKTMLQATKEKGIELTIFEELKIGGATLGHSLLKFSDKEEIKARQEMIVMAPGKVAEEVMPELKCGEPKIIAVDYSWIAKREKSGPKLQVKLIGDQALDIEAELEDCTPMVSPAPTTKP